MSYPYLSDIFNQLFGTGFHIPLATFGSFVAIAILLGLEFGKHEVRRLAQEGILGKAWLSNGKAIEVHLILADMTFISVIAGVIGARLFHLLEYPHEFIAAPLQMIFSTGGLSIYGGLIFGTVAGVLFLKKRSVPILPLLDAFAPAMMLGYAIGRIGCQISGDGDWGKAADMLLKPDFLPDFLWAQTYMNNIIGVHIPAPGVYPTPIYEAILSLLFFGLLWKLRKLTYTPGFIFSWYLILSGSARFLIEKIRINSKYQIFEIAFTQAELISIVFIGMGLYGILRARNSHRKPSME